MICIARLASSICCGLGLSIEASDYRRTVGGIIVENRLDFVILTFQDSCCLHPQSSDRGGLCRAPDLKARRADLPDGIHVFLGFPALGPMALVTVACPVCHHLQS